MDEAIGTSKSARSQTASPGCPFVVYPGGRRAGLGYSGRSLPGVWRMKRGLF